ncbi:MAG: 50S ribosomal protein L5 [Candidatus Babeliales bacterium]
MARARLDELYKKEIRPQLKKDLGYGNIMEVPKLSKIVVNIGVKEAVSDSRILTKVADVLAKITGQVPVRTLAKKSIAGFKIREDMPIGLKVTLRKDSMYEFLDRLVNLALPKVKDFQGLKTKLDTCGNYNLGLKEWSIFPEAEKASEELASGMNITFHIVNKKNEDALALLKKFGMPFKKAAR